MQHTRIDDVELVTKMTHEEQSFQVLNFFCVRECGATAGPKWAHKCALHFAAAWGHRGTLVGELAARTGLRGDVEVAHPATFPGFSFDTASPSPRMLNILLQSVITHYGSALGTRVVRGTAIVGDHAFVRVPLRPSPG